MAATYRLFKVLIVDAEAAAAALRRSGPVAVDAELDRRPGGDDAVVLVLAHHVRARGAQNPDDPEGDVADADHFADGRFVVEQFPLHRGADQADRLARADVGIGEAIALLQVFPIAGSQVVRRGARQLLRGPVAVSIDRLGPGPRPWARPPGRRDTRWAISSTSPGLRDWTVPRPWLTPPVLAAPGKMSILLAPMLAIDLVNRGLRALADLRHGDDGRHADDHAQGRQAPIASCSAADCPRPCGAWAAAGNWR